MSSIDIKELARRGDAQRGTPVAPRRHILSRYLLPGVLVVGFLALFAWTTRDAYLPRKPVHVAPVFVSLADVQTAGTPLFKAAGWIEPRPTPIRVTALAPGVVRELLVVEDQHVSQDEPIARLIDEDAKLDVDQAEAMLALRQAELQEADAALAAATTNLNVPAHLEAALAEVEAALAAVNTELSNLPNQLRRAEARLELAEATYEIKESSRGAIPEIQILQAQAELDAAQAEVDEFQQREPLLLEQQHALMRQRDALATRLELKTDEHQALATAEARVAAANARVREAEVALDTAELRLERMTISASVEGRILHLLASPGTQLMSGPNLTGDDASTVVTMYQPSQLQVRVDVRFEDLPRVVRDQPVLVESPALPAPLTGRVLFLTGFANIQKNTLEVKVSLDAPPEVLKPDMLVDVTFVAPEQEDADESASSEYRMFVPRELVQFEGEAAFVWVADLSGQTAHRTSVTLGPIQTPELLEITGGLTAASRIITSGRENLEDGDRIEVQGEDPGIGRTAITPNPPNH